MGLVLSGKKEEIIERYKIKNYVLRSTLEKLRQANIRPLYLTRNFVLGLKDGSNHLLYTIPFVYYGIFRYLYLIHKIKNEGDPTRILFRDKKLQLDVLLWISACIFIIYLGV